MPAVANPSTPSALAVFRNRSFTLLWTAQFVSAMGSALTSLAASILVYRLTGSALSVGLMLMATALPSLFVGLIAGVFVDRWDRKRIMIIADLIRGGLVLLIPWLVSYHIAWLYIIVALSSAVGQFFDPAHESILPEVATEAELAAANSLMAISTFGSTAIGFAASGLIASSASIEWAFYIDGLTFFFSMACLLLIRVAAPRVDEKTSVAAVIHNLRAGARHILQTDSLRSLFFIYVFVFIGFGQWNSLQLPFATRALGATEFDYGVLEALGAVGFAVGSLALAGLADRLREGQWITISFVGMAVASLAFSFSTWVPLALTLFALQGLLNAPSVIARRLIIQRNTPREMRGRVASAFFVSRDVVWILGMALAGLADFFDVRLLLVINSLVFLGVAVISAFLPGLGQPAAEWRRAIRLLRGAKAAPRLGVGRAATLADFDRLAMRLSAFATLSAPERQHLASQTLITEATGGTVVVARGETSDAAYFILEGRAVAGYLENDTYQLLEVLNPGDFFGEIAALTGIPRTANVIADEDTTLLQVPAEAVRQMMSKPQLNRLFISKMTERMVRMNMIDTPRAGALDQQALRELRTPGPEASA